MPSARHPFKPPSRLRASTRLLVLVLAGVLLAGCESLAFYRQAVAGQFEIWRRERAITTLLADPALAESTRTQLELALRALAFAADTLALPAAGSYRTYAELDRPYVVWNVFAAPALSLTPVRSCFLFAGCLDYRGYFSREDAERYAARLAASGHDVFVGGVPAYSTLGWFDDPLLSTFLHWDEADLVELLFHELAHQVLYVSGDTAFNESYANAVANAGLARWFADRADDAARARASRATRAAMTTRILRTRSTLEALYASDAVEAVLLAHKQTELVALEEALTAIARAAGDAAPPGPPWNNARIAAVATYHDHEPAFLALLDLHAGDFARFHLAAARIGRLSPAARTACLEQLSGADALPDCAR